MKTDPRRVVAIIQARMGSTRLPGKVLKPLAGQPMLGRVVERTRRAKRVQETAVATTGAAQDNPIADLCASRAWPFTRGSERDLLDRYHAAAIEHRADAVVRVTSDCPLIDSGVIDRVVDAFEKGDCDYASNTLEPRTFPRGLDVEVVGFQALDRAWREDTNPQWREHATPYIYRHPERFRLRPVRNDRDLSFHRWTVDSPEDYELARRIYDHFRHDRFAWTDVLKVLDEHPDWVQINRHVQQKLVP
jgi:spore coat polysaccharide biosynthesis protein SpsF